MARIGVQVDQADQVDQAGQVDRVDQEATTVEEVQVGMVTQEEMGETLMTQIAVRSEEESRDGKPSRDCLFKLFVEPAIEFLGQKGR